MSGRVEFVSTRRGIVVGWVDEDGGADEYGAQMLASPLVAGLGHAGKVRRYAEGWSNGYIHTRVVSSVDKGRRGPGQRYRHNWIPLAETLFDSERDYGRNHVAMSVRADGTASVYVADSELSMQVTDLPGLVDALDRHLERHEAGDRDDPTYVGTDAGEVQITSLRDDLIEIQFETRDGDLDAIKLAPDEVEQFTADLDELARQHDPHVLSTQQVSADLAFDLYSHDRVGIRAADDTAAELVLARGEIDDVAGALSKLHARYGAGSQEWDEHGEAMPADERDFPGGLTVRWYSDNSASIIRGPVEARLPAGQVQAAIVALGKLFETLAPSLTAKGERLVRRLAKLAGEDTLTKVREGTPAGRHRARHLIRWFNEGAEGRIPWGAHGDFDACVAEASKHMSPKHAKGFCNLRHKDALGIYPATHAARERKGKG